MKYSRFSPILAAIALSACSSGMTGAPSTPPQPSLANAAATAPLTELGNLNYSDGSITVYHIASNTASVFSHFRPENGTAQGIAIDKNGLVYTTITGGKRCGTCVEVFTPQGHLTNTLIAPKVTGAAGTASLTSVSIDAAGDVYVSDGGQEAVYYYPPGSGKTTKPTVILTNIAHLGAIDVVPNGRSVVVGGCSFGSSEVYRRGPSGAYTPSRCFSEPAFSLLGSSSDDFGVTLTPLNPARPQVAVSSPNGQFIFETPNKSSAHVSSVALSLSGGLLYAADVSNEYVYAFARPGKGWLNGGQPQAVAQYKGFQNLNMIAVPQ